MIAFEQFTNNAQSTLNGPITAGATSLVVASASTFPTVPQFRVTIDSEIFLVTGVSGNTFTVIGGQQGTTPANHNSNALVSGYITAEIFSDLFNNNLGTLNYLEYNPAGMSSFADQTTQIQNFLLYCQLVAFAMKGNLTGLDDQIQRHYVTAYFPYGTTRDITCPIIIPEFVNVLDNGGFKRDGTTGTVTPSYNGDTTSKALANLYQPGFVCAINGQCQSLNLYCNPDGAHGGSGLAVGKNWVPSGVTLVSSGTGGYQAGNVLTLAQPSKSPYSATRVTVDTVDGSGNILTYHLSTIGTYALPDKLQQQQWTAANGFSGSIAAGSHGQVFDGVNPGAFITGGGSGSGATFTQQWKPDWDGVNTLYYMGGELIGNTYLGNIIVNAVGFSTNPATGDPTYGFKFGVMISSLNTVYNEIGTGGGDWGVAIINASDVRGNITNPVGGGTLLKIQASGSVECPNCVLDTPSQSFLDVDGSGGVVLTAQCINPVSNPALGSGYAYRIGANTTQVSACLSINLNFTDCGTLAGVPGGSISYVKGSKFDVKITNYKLGGSAGTHLITRFCDFVTAVDASNDFRGSFDWGSQTPGPLFGGTFPGCAFRVWNANVNNQGVGGFCENGNYRISAAAIPTTGTWTQNDQVIFPATAGQPPGAVCVAGGTPGVWKNFASLGA